MTPQPRPAAPHAASHAPGADAPGTPAPADPDAHLRHWPPGVPRSIKTGHETLWQGLAQRAQATPQTEGLHFLGRSWTWAALHAEAEHLAGALQHLGLQPGDRVLLFMQNCPQFVVAFHAVLRCAAVVVPVNPMNKADELPHYVADAGARVAIASSDIASEMARASDTLDTADALAHLIVFDLADALPVASERSATGTALPPAWQDWLGTRHAPPTLHHGAVHAWADLLARQDAPGPYTGTPHDLTLLPYTSGTTGQPKGCRHTHATLQHNALASGPWHDMRTGDVVLIVVPLFHITGLVMGMVAAIRLGCRMVLLPRWDRNVAARTIATQRVTHWPNIPTMVIDLLAAPDLDAYDLSALRYIGGGGAPMPAAVATALQQRFGLTYIEGYGLTETAAPTHTNPPQAARRASLGIPHISTAARVIDPQTLQPLPVDTVGEIVVRGPQVFLGYWNQPQATAEAFVEINGARYFRTGDLGRVDADGYYTMADRLKRMINASGFKVWPAEVEGLLHHHPAVQECCVIARRDAYRGETVKALIVRRAGHNAVRPQDIMTWAREHMAVYKIPRDIEFVAALPRTASGKVLWRALQAEQDARDALADAPAPAQAPPAGTSAAHPASPPDA